MAIDFYIANNIEEAENAKENLHFPEEIHDHLCNRKNEFLEGLKNLVALDPYDYKILEKEKIKKIIEDIDQCDLKKIDSAAESFLKNKLYDFFKEALGENKNICAIGD